MKILVTAGRGMLGASIVQSAQNSDNPIEVVSLTRADVDLRDFDAVSQVLKSVKPDYVVHTAAKVGGIAANIAAPTEFLADNLLIDSAVIEGSRRAGIENLIYFGSSCMYPRDYRQPLIETDILAAPLEPTNEGYALAKITGAKLCSYISEQYGYNYRVLIPSNLYGPGDDYTPGKSHLVASTLVKAHNAKTSGVMDIDVWGDGLARREFTYVEDVADWVVHEMNNISNWPQLLNLGIGTDHSIADFYSLAMEVVGVKANLVFDPTKPAGMRQKLMDSSLAKQFGWNPTTSMFEGMKSAYSAFLSL